MDYSRLCGRALVRAHARTGDAIAIADQIQDDYRRLESATAAGEIDAEPGR